MIEDLAYQIALQGVKHNISRTLNAVVVGDCRFGRWLSRSRIRLRRVGRLALAERVGEREGFFSTPSMEGQNPSP